MSKPNVIAYFSGTARWCYLRKPDKKYGLYSINLYPSDEDLKRLAKDYKGAIKIKEDNEGKKFVVFRRPDSKVTAAGKKLVFGPPDVLDPNGDPLDEAEMVGNGSKVIVKVIAYETARGRAMRLDAVKVTELESFRINSVEVDEGGLGDEAPF